MDRTPPNIIHLMWDDQPMGAVGIPALQQIRGYSTPKLNQMAAEGMLFTRMYTEPSCTPTRAAAMTGQHPVRNGMTASQASGSGECAWALAAIGRLGRLLAGLDRHSDQNGIDSPRERVALPRKRC